MPRAHSRLRPLAAVLLVLATHAAAAAPCAGFADVPSASAFCSHVEWIRNRGITLGCSSPALFCPEATVTRLQMAAFMNRLGAALTPVQLRVESFGSAVALDANAVVCRTDPFAVVDFPRRAYADASFFARASADVGYAADLVSSVDGGVTWTNLNTVGNRGFIPANLWGGIADIGYVDLDVDQSVRFGVRVTRGGLAGTVDIVQSGCQLRVLVYGRDGAASPL